MPETGTRNSARLALAWAFVGLPLLWGVAMTLKSALPLFG